MNNIKRSMAVQGLSEALIETTRLWHRNAPYFHDEPVEVVKDVIVEALLRALDSLRKTPARDKDTVQ